MLNETALVKQWLNGENIDPKISYRMCWLLSKWFYEHGITDTTCVRDKIFEWAKANNLFLNINVNDCIKNALTNKRRLTSDNPIRVSNEDVKEIVRRFDRKNVRLCALGLLCYAKQFANQDKKFELPYMAFGNWIGIAYNNISNRYMPEIEYFGYVTKGKARVRYVNETFRASSTVYTIHVPIMNEGEYTIKENDIRGLYDEIFAYI